MSELKTKWPDRDWYVNYSSADWRGYERARAEAALERLRVCEAVLQDIRVNAHTLEDAIGYAKEALAAIGPIPGEQT